MIYLLVGENVYARERECERIVDSRDNQTRDGDELELHDLPDLLSGQTLFSSEQVIIIRGASNNKAVWEAIGERAGTLDETTTLILLESKVDKRTRAYKTLQKSAKIISCDPWSERDTRTAESWLQSEASARNIPLSGGQIRDMVERAIRPSELDEKAIIDQQLLATALEQLAGQQQVTDDMIDAVLPPATHENVFALLSASIAGDIGRVQSMVRHLSAHQDGHRTLALLASQATNLAALVLAGGRSSDAVASDIGAHPYALRQLSGLARQLDRGQVTRIVDALATADERAKSGGEIWSVIETALVTIGSKH